MNDHPINLAVRFGLELAALAAFGLLGWKAGGSARYILAIALPLTAMVLWGVFRVPGDPGKAPVAVAGYVRLLLEAFFFGTAAAAFFFLDYRIAGWAFLAVTILHYAVSYDRIIRLLHG